MRASAAARASSAASVTDVWSVLADPQRWAEFEPFVRSVALYPPEPSGEAEPRTVAEGQQLRARLRLLPAAVAVEVDHVVNRSSLAATVRLLPGLQEEVEHLLIPSASGGSVLTVRIRLHGPLALPALLPRYLLRTLTVRLLARSAENSLRARERQVPSVA